MNSQNEKMQLLGSAPVPKALLAMGVNLLYPSGEGHQYCLQFLTIVNSAEMNMVE